MLLSETASTAPPLNRPADFASRTIPVARAPFGIATRPFTSIGEETVAAKVCPFDDVLEPTGSSSTTEIVVSAGIVIGFGENMPRPPDLFAEAEPPEFPAEEPLLAESVDAD